MFCRRIELLIFTSGFYVYHIIEDEGVISGEEWFWHDLYKSKLSRDKIRLVAQEGKLVPRLPEPS